MANFSVFLPTLFTYPFYVGGVSTWCDTLCRNLADVDFSIFAVTGEENLKKQYKLPPNVRKLVRLPLSLNDQCRLQDLSALTLTRKKDPSQRVINEEFIPQLGNLVRRIIDIKSLDLSVSAETIYHLWLYFQRYDWNKTWESKSVTEAFHRSATMPYEEGLDDIYPDFRPSNYDLAAASGWLKHYLSSLNIPIPATDLVHLTSTAQVAGIISKQEYGTPVVLTEHGPFARNTYLLALNLKESSFVKSFAVRLASLLCKINYAFADVICATSEFNRRWEAEYGADSRKIEVIYNGIDPKMFSPKPKPARTKLRPTAVAAASVVPLKDIETLIRSAAIVRQSIPDFHFNVYGSMTINPGYVRSCCKLISELNLKGVFELKGVQSEPSTIYNEGDITVLASLTESCPYAIVESMSCGRPVVCTDVGDVKKIVGNLGIVVSPRDVTSLAGAMVMLLRDEQLRLKLGQKARDEIVTKYNSVRMVETYWNLYQKVTIGARRDADRKKFAYQGAN